MDIEARRRLEPYFLRRMTPKRLHYKRHKRLLLEP